MLSFHIPLDHLPYLLKKQQPQLADHCFSKWLQFTIHNKEVTYSIPTHLFLTLALLGPLIPLTCNTVKSEELVQWGLGYKERKVALNPSLLEHRTELTSLRHASILCPGISLFSGWLVLTAMPLFLKFYSVPPQCPVWQQGTWGGIPKYNSSRKKGGDNSDSEWEWDFSTVPSYYLPNLADFIEETSIFKCGTGL